MANPRDWQPPSGATAWEQAAEQPRRTRVSDRLRRVVGFWLPVAALVVMTVVVLVNR